VPAAARLALEVRDAAAATRARLERHGEAIRRLARCARIDIATGPAPRGAVQVVVDEATYALPLTGVVDLEQERRRLDRELAKAAAQLERFDQKLGNPQFLDRAPAAVIEEQRARRAEVEQTRQKLAAALARIAS
jgi:valyl-tRNA synthetase